MASVFLEGSQAQVGRQKARPGRTKEGHAAGSWEQLQTHEQQWQSLLEAKSCCDCHWRQEHKTSCCPGPSLAP